MKKQIYFLLAAGILALASCKKKDDLTPQTNRPANFGELTAPANFSFRTNTFITLNVQGLKTYSVVKNVLKVTSVDGTEIYYLTPASMDQNLSLKISIPQKVKEVNVQFGSIVKKVAINGSTISFNYSRQLPNVN